KDDAPFPDAEPLAGQLGILIGATLAGGCAVVNPLGSVVLQNKRAMALLWEHIERFPVWAQDAVRRYLPLTVRLETLDPAELAARKDLWVLKSDYGCEGAEVVIGVETPEDEWREAL